MRQVALTASSHANGPRTTRRSFVAINSRHPPRPEQPERGIFGSSGTGVREI
jgi:hypothetical protein